MAASTQTASNGRTDMRELIRRGLQNATDISPAMVYGDALLHPWGDTFTVPTTAIDDVNDILRLSKMPAGSYIWQLRVTATDMDTNATPTLSGDFLVVDDSDVTKATLIANTTIGQAGGTAVLDNAAIGEFVGGYWLAWKTDAVSATPAAGTFKVVALISLGILQPSSTVGNPRVTDSGV